jgi:fermentation-respiration switch protein FrsA (DUF1100 family)
MFRWFEHGRVYHPTKEWEASGADVGHPWEDAYFPATDGVKLNGWFFSVPADSPRSQMVLLVCHGNGGNISHRVRLCRALLQTGMNVLVFDYRGYGRSDGRPDEEGTYRDTQGAYRWLRQRGFAPANIVAFGESLGGGMVSELAVREPLAGLVLQSTFTSIPDIGSEFYPWLPVRWIGTIKYDTLSKLPRIRTPLLVMHSREDSMVRFHHAQRNFAAANESKMFWETFGGHNYSQIPDFDRCLAGLERFLAALAPPEMVG